MKKLKVLMVAGSMGVGGIENQLMHVIRNSDKEKIQIDFTTTNPNAFFRKEIESLGGHIIVIPRMNWKNPFPYCKALFNIMKKRQYDVVHSHELFHSGITLTIAALAGVPCRFAHAHNWQDGDGTGKNVSIIRKTYNFVMRFLINTFSTSQIACSTWAGRFVFGAKKMKQSSYHLVVNSVDTKKFLDQYDQVEDGEFCEDNWINVLHVGRMTTVKNQKFLVQIAEEMKKRNRRIRILCAGSGDKEYENETREMIQKKELEEYIKLLGIRSDIDVLMRKSKAFVLPSKYEGMPLVMIEAQASGLFCVSANTYSPEVDFGIKRLKWLSLEEGPSVWADEILKAVEAGRAEKCLVVDAIKRKGFDSRFFAKKLLRLYEHDFECAKRKL